LRTKPKKKKGEGVAKLGGDSDWRRLGVWILSSQGKKNPKFGEGLNGGIKKRDFKN